LKALRERQPKITVRTGGQSVPGEFVLVGNGRFYGGSVSAFRRPICATGFWTSASCAPELVDADALRAGSAHEPEAAGEHRTIHPGGQI